MPRCSEGGGEGGGGTLSPSPKLSRPRGSSRSKFANSFHLAALLRFQKGFGARLLPRLFGFPPTGKSPRVNKKDAVDAGKKKKRKGVRCCRASKEQAQDKRDKLRGKAKGEFPLCLFAPGIKGTLWSCRDRTAVFAHQSRPRPPLASCPLLDVRGVEGRFDSVQQSAYIARLVYVFVKLPLRPFFHCLLLFSTQLFPYGGDTMKELEAPTG